MRMPVVLVRHVVRSAWGLVGAASRIRVGGGDYGGHRGQRQPAHQVAAKRGPAASAAVPPAVPGCGDQQAGYQHATITHMPVNDPNGAHCPTSSTTTNATPRAADLSARTVAAQISATTAVGRLREQRTNPAGTAAKRDEMKIRKGALSVPLNRLARRHSARSSPSHKCLRMLGARSAKDPVSAPAGARHPPRTNKGSSPGGSHHAWRRFRADPRAQEPQPHPRTAAQRYRNRLRDRKGSPHDGFPAKNRAGKA